MAVPGPAGGAGGAAEPGGETVGSSCEGTWTGGGITGVNCEGAGEAGAVILAGGGIE